MSAPTSEARARSAPRPWERRWRPLGYLVVGAVWLVLTAVTLAAVLFLVVAAPAGAFPPLSETLREQFADPKEVVAFAVSMLLLSALLGPVCWYLPAACWPCAVLALVYVKRSFQARYAGERLSRTQQSFGTLGPPVVTSTALSLLPVRDSRVTRAVMQVYASAWSPQGRQARATLLTGPAYLLFVGAAAWPVHGLLRALLVTVSGVLLAVSVVGVVRETRRRFAPAVAAA
ncbi:hypothetical protein [Cellulomonas dongxiuzhuiae]|uniref:SNARE associated Golgi protein n=1 Tax=Cellulomonas dongxiuzhuiae TaxID=2819979 RepID=A0ABX8GH06_9CELL|nr:hypothetical protein [Cellulomonas dongxiuzhuiae]MBO3094389.1 hypothetical protein [Cellulomonas dongxiuzhuiae]QWC15417.1 hypothetical protein KKR89_14090 [Cellulomonas dongxiuzhuiae]